MTATTVTMANLEAMADSLPLDMQAEITAALSSGSETAIEYERTGEYNAQAVHYVYFPNAGRGGVCGGGNTDWTDCGSLEDLAGRTMAATSNLEILSRGEPGTADEEYCLVRGDEVLLDWGPAFSAYADLYEELTGDEIDSAHRRVNS